MKKCFAAQVVLKSGKEDMIPMAGKHMEDASHKVKKLPEVRVITNMTEISFLDYTALKTQRRAMAGNEQVPDLQERMNALREQNFFRPKKKMANA